VFLPAHVRAVCTRLGISMVGGDDDDEADLDSGFYDDAFEVLE
jgi:hypothetical protein